ncbi:MAG: monovalent cation/H+ antiporter subunit D family protein [Candidatus Omnitrophica bacterium]|nr:monovalent cation/H+ antiporter subunit D family protein [Candidatus Omnitrophota bacterium]MCB9720163.1 monovalent cation/H+ antiporter subunit D family protein [Candidatus Omnitrophota bacterium]
MSMTSLLPLVIFATSFLTGVIIFFIKEEAEGLRTFINIFNAVLKILLVGWLMWGVYQGTQYEFRFPLFLGFDIVLNADSLSLLFVGLSAVLWLLTTLYAIGYLQGSPDQSRFFGFFCLCVSATTGIALAGNLFTLLVFYEFLTLSTYPLVTHKGDRESLQAGRIYLAYTLIGGVVLLWGMVWLSSLVGPADFAERGILSALPPQSYGQAIAIFVLLILGFGVKAALVPLHGWLPKAMVAPAPVSALLHAVAVVKAGAFGIVRVVYDVYGIKFCAQLGILRGLGILAAVTILYGSIRALFQDDLKKRLAYSTVSQVSYIALGVATVGPIATIGGIVHLVHQGITKITLFFCAGNFAEGLHIKRISAMNGIGRRMPWTMAAFTVGALGMIGVPPMAGFISKWYLGMGALRAGQGWVVPVLLGSSLLNAAYFLPIIYAGWFKEPDERAGQGELTQKWFENRAYLLFPPLITASLVILMGLFAGLPFSPLAWVKLITLREYGLAD